MSHLAANSTNLFTYTTPEKDIETQKSNKNTTYAGGYHKRYNVEKVSLIIVLITARRTIF